MIPFTTLITKERPKLTKDFFSKRGNFDNNLDPKWIIHVTDLHLNSFNKTRTANLKTYFNKIKNVIQPSKYIFSGDIVDNRENVSFFPYRKQLKKDWDEFYSFFHELDILDDSIFCAGDHEVFNIRDFNSEHHYGREYNISKYPMQRFNMTLSDGGNISFLVINPYTFPSPPVSMIWFVEPHVAMLDKINSEIDQYAGSLQIIVTHHPAYMWYPNSGIAANYTFDDILLQKSNVRLVLTGHLHPPNVLFYHHGEALEVVGTPSFAYPNIVGLVSFDNNRTVYHSVNLDDEPIVIITNPLPYNQVSGMDIFNEKDITIRAVAFTSEELNLTITGDIEGELQYVRDIGTDISLYELSYTLNEGTFTIHKVGNWSGSLTFCIGNTQTGFYESSVHSEPSVSFPFLLFYTLAVILVVAFPGVYRGVGEDFEEWLCESSDKSQWFIAFFGGFLIIHRYVQRSPVCKYIYALIFYPFFFPLVLFEVDKRGAMIFLFGWVANFKFQLYFHGFMWTLYYYLIVLFPFIFALSSLQMTHGTHWVFIIDMIIYMFSFVLLVVKVKTLCEFYNILPALFSPGFVIIPIICLIVFIIRFFKHKNDISNTTDSFAPSIIKSQSFYQAI